MTDAWVNTRYHDENDRQALITAQEIIYLSDDIVADNRNIHLIYTPEDLLLEVA